MIEGQGNKMTTRNQYRQDHKIAKAIVFMLVVLCLVINREFDSMYIDILAVFIWLFGVNPIGYLVESIRHHSHNHDKV